MNNPAHGQPADEHLRLFERFSRSSPIAMVAIDSAQRVQLCNPSFERLFGLRETDILGTSIDGLITGPDRIAESLDLNARVLDGEVVQAVSTRRRSDGVDLHVEITLVPVLHDGRTAGAYAMYRDLTEQNRSTRRLALQHAVTTVLAEAATVDDTIPRILSAVGENLGWATGAMWLADAASGELRSVAAWQAPGVDARGLHAQSHEVVFAAGSGLPGRAAAERQAVWVPDVISDGLIRADAAVAAGLRAAVAFPIRHGERTLGVLEFFSFSIQQPDEELLRTLTAVGLQVGAFLERKRLESELDRFFAMSPEMLCFAGTDGFFKRINPSWSRVLGYPEAELLSQPYLAFVHPDDVAKTMEEASCLADGRTTVSFENRYRCRDGSYKWLLWSAMLDTSQGIIYAVTRDNTDRREAEQQMREALQMKSDFVSFVTHQLRTPLAGIKWMLELAADAPDREELTSYVQDARESAERLISLVNDLLDISRLESGKLQVSPEPVDVVALTRGVLQDIATLVADKQHRLVVNASADLPRPVIDPQLIRQVVMNLLSNAIKYTPHGGSIDVTIAASDGMLHWAVKDSGIGIPESGQARLFEKFFRAENALSVDTEGTGLGLYLVRLIIERFNGTVACQSQQGAGSTFSFTLPLAPGAAS